MIYNLATFWQIQHLCFVIFYEIAVHIHSFPRHAQDLNVSILPGIEWNLLAFQFSPVQLGVLQGSALLWFD